MSDVDDGGSYNTTVFIVVISCEMEVVIKSWIPLTDRTSKWLGRQ